ncbi:cytochrome c oxidase subunit II [Marinobacterium jannaschii]|uniref:cytochrome c oxidase subunit II n=1 Tax=Marinobacterium jannaschii TaxID=64970 RepID=UPI0006867AAC|nr:cytochrome c oxidase subunit II [Marinobacterium jannaschii]
MALAIVLILIVVASVLFHIYSPWWITEAASNWGAIDNTLLITILLTGFFFVVITLFVVLALIRYRHREGRKNSHRAAYEPENRRLEWWLMGITGIGIVAMLAPGLFVYEQFIDVPEDAHEVEVVGQQWQWAFRFPGEDRTFGKSHVRWIADNNPLGLNPDDPAGQDDQLVLGNEVHLPLGQPVKLLLRSKDVLHNFYVPQIRGKMDMVPGTVSWFWFTPTRNGRFEILCAEFCGIGHYSMRGLLQVEPHAEFRSWLAQQPTLAALLQREDSTPEDPLLKRGRLIAQQQGCLACHSVDGSKSLGPGWKGLFGRKEKLSDGSEVLVDEAYLKRSITDPADQLVAGYPAIMVAYNLASADLDALVAYIRSLTAATDNSQGSSQ